MGPKRYLSAGWEVLQDAPFLARVRTKRETKFDRVLTRSSLSVLLMDGKLGASAR